MNMTYYILKIVVTTGLVIAASEFAKRSAMIGGLLASLPLVSFLGIIWLYVETRMQRKWLPYHEMFFGWSWHRYRFSCCYRTCLDATCTSTSASAWRRP